jgi:CRISPR-associated protein Cmr2
MKNYTFEENGQKQSPTLSVGIAILHHIEPLSDGLDLARRTEKLAKVTRNALAIGISKRSGSETFVSGTWGSIDARLDAWCNLYASGAIPEGTGYHLREAALTLEARDAPMTQSNYQEMMRHELQRILGRRQTGQKHPNSKGHEESILFRYDLGGMRMSQLANELILAKFLHEAWELSRWEEKGGRG